MLEYIKSFFDWLVKWLSGNSEAQPPKVPVPPKDPVSKWPKFTTNVGVGTTDEKLVGLVIDRLFELDFLDHKPTSFDSEVKSAVQAFQIFHKIGNTGIVGAQTWPVLFSDNAKSAPPHGGSGHAMKPKVDSDMIAECPNYASRNGVDIDTLILHNTEGSSSSAVSRFLNADEQVSAHYIVDRDGELIQMVSDSMTAWHSGARSTNQRSIGIEIVAGGGQGNGMTEIQQSVVVQLCKFIMDAYEVPLSRVMPHRQIVSTSCPGSIWKTDAELESWKKKYLA